FAIARFRIADEPQAARLDVFEAADVIPEREVRDVVVERVRGEVTAPDIVVDGAVDVVAQDAAPRVEQPLGVAFFVEAVAAAGVAIARIAIARVAILSVAAAASITWVPRVAGVASLTWATRVASVACSVRWRFRRGAARGGGWRFGHRTG